MVRNSSARDFCLSCTIIRNNLKYSKKISQQCINNGIHFKMHGQEVVCEVTVSGFGVHRRTFTSVALHRNKRWVMWLTVLYKLRLHYSFYMSYSPRWCRRRRKWKFWKEHDRKWEEYKRNYVTKTNRYLDHYMDVDRRFYFRWFAGKYWS